MICVATARRVTHPRSRTRRGARHSRAVSGARLRELREIVQHYERVNLGCIGGALDRGHVVIGVGVLMFAGAEIRRRDAGVVEVALVESGRRVVGLGRLAQHDLARGRIALTMGDSTVTSDGYMNGPSRTSTL